MAANIQNDICDSLPLTSIVLMQREKAIERRQKPQLGIFGIEQLESVFVRADWDHEFFVFADGLDGGKDGPQDVRMAGICDGPSGFPHQWEAANDKGGKNFYLRGIVGMEWIAFSSP